MQPRRSSSRLAALALVAATLCLLASCASGAAYRRASRQLSKGDLAGAALSAADSLAHNPKNYKSLAMLEKTFPRARAELEAAAAKALEGEDPFRWEAVVASWTTIHAMNDAIRALPPLYRKKSKSPVEFSFAYDAELLARARDEAAAARYAEGLALAAAGGRASYRKAFGSFAAALGFAPGYRDAEARAAEARDLGSDHIAVLPFAAPAGDYAAAACAGILYDATISALVEEAASKDFLRVVDRALVEEMVAERELAESAVADDRAGLDARGLQGANVLVTGQVLSLKADYPSVSRRVERFRQEIEEPVPGAAPVNGVVPKQKVWVEASVTVFEKSASVCLTAACRAVDAETSVVLESKTVSRSADDGCRWAVASGDPRALSPGYADLAGRREAPIKGPEELLPGLCVKIAREFAQAVAARF